MTDLPRGWADAPLSRLGTWRGGGTPSKRIPAFWQSGTLPWVSPKDMKVDVIHDSADHITEAALRASTTNLIGPGSVLVVTRSGILRHTLPVATTSRYVTINQDLKALTLHPGLVPGYIAWGLRANAQRILRECSKTGTTVQSIETAQLLRFVLSIAPTAEQERIVAAIEEQFSRLDAGMAALERVLSRLEQIARAVIIAAIPKDMPSNWTLLPVGDAGHVQLGRQRSPRFHAGPNMHPYLRVANVFEDRIETLDVMAMHFSESEFRQYELKPGDILLNEGQSPHLLGRPAMYRGNPPNVAFTNSLLRFQAKEGILSSWALLVFRRHLHARRFMKESQITTNIAHLSAGRFKTIEFPVPPIEEQRQIVSSVNERLSSVALERSSAERSLARAGQLRSSILAAAFAGKLLPQDPNDEPAAVLLKRVASQRAPSNGYKSAYVRKSRTVPSKVTA